jgi:diguanylate cyclase (GGDEF)-like protein
MKSIPQTAESEFLALLKKADEGLPGNLVGALECLDQAERLLAKQVDAFAALRLRLIRAIAGIYGTEPLQGLAELYRVRGELADCPDLTLRSRAERGLANAHEVLGTYETALSHAQAAREWAEQAGDELEQLHGLRCSAVLLSRLGRPEEGLKIYQQLDQAYAALKLPQARVAVLNNIGINLKNLGRFEESVQSYEAALTLMQATGDLGRQSFVRLNLAEALCKAGRCEAALALLDELAANAQLNLGSYTQAQMLRERGLVLWRLQRQDDALQCWREGAEISRGAGLRGLLSELLKELANALQTRVQYQEALSCHQEAVALDKALFDERGRQQLNALQVQLELQGARHEAEVHRLRHVELSGAHEELRRLNQALEQALAEKDQLLAQLEARSRTDALTGLANRRHLDERLQMECERSGRYGHGLVLAVLDIDHFKSINDRWGHVLGDAVLRQVAQLLRSNCRSTDLVARYGGEEFCLLFVESDLTSAQIAVQQLCADVREHPWAALVPDLQVRLSGGLAMLRAGDEAMALLQRADQALYQAKAEGRDRVLCAMHSVAA